MGVLVQANHGRRDALRVNGVPVGERIGAMSCPLPASGGRAGAGSIIVLVATDAPLLPAPVRAARPAGGFGMARTGGVGEHSSGDFVLCFATGNRGLEPTSRGAPAADAATTAGSTALFEAASTPSRRRS